MPRQDRVTPDRDAKESNRTKHEQMRQDVIAEQVYTTRLEAEIAAVKAWALDTFVKTGPP